MASGLCKNATIRRGHPGFKSNSQVPTPARRSFQELKCSLPVHGGAAGRQYLPSRLPIQSDTEVSPAQRIYFAAAQNDCSDEEIISFWLSVSSLEGHQVPMFVAKHWAKHASNFIEWMGAFGG